MAGVQIRKFRFSILTVPFKTSFRHASAERSETSSVWIDAFGDGAVGCGESCPRPYVTGESIESAQAFFTEHESSVRERVHDLVSLRTWMEQHRADIDRNPAAWCALELATLDLMARQAGVTIESLLGLAPLAGHFRYTAVLGDMSADAFGITARRYRELGFTDFKVKLAGDLDRDRQKLSLLAGQPAVRIRVDANNLWPAAEDAIAFLAALDAPLFAVEEPLSPPGQFDRLAHVAKRVGCRIVLDESFSRDAQVTSLTGDPTIWIGNLRVSKMGGLLRALDVASALRTAGIDLIVGAQVGETSLLTRAALTVAHANRERLVAQEGAFGTLLLERDVCDPPLMFGRGGVVDVAAFPMLARPGFGIDSLGSSR
jgi:L-alanine-DL-glutamate epimerase-like enolase superfamily enzyme